MKDYRDVGTKFRETLGQTTETLGQNSYQGGLLSKNTNCQSQIPFFTAASRYIEDFITMTFYHVNFERARAPPPSPLVPTPLVYNNFTYIFLSTKNSNCDY